MKITGLKTHLVKLPSAPTLAGIADKADQYTFVTLQLRTDEGVEGIGISFFGGARSEPNLIRLAFALEQATKLRRRPRFLPMWS